MDHLPTLPFGWTWPVVGLAVVAVVGTVLQQVLGDQISETVSGWRRRAATRRRGGGHDRWDRYATWVLRTYNHAKLGFGQDGDPSVLLDTVYVPLQYERDGRRIDIYRDIQSRLRTVVLGPAGAGKSTILRHSMLQWAAAPQGFDRVPVLVELGWYNADERTVEDLVVAAFALRTQVDDTRRHKNKKQRDQPPPPLVDDAERVVPDALAAGRLCVFLDGLDEVVTDRRGAVALKIKEFAGRYPDCQIVVTCRDAVYDKDLVPSFDRTITVAGFDDAGIRQYLRLWFTRPRKPTGDAGPPSALDEAAPDPREQVEQLVAELRANPTLMRLARSPLLLTMIAFLHDVDPGEGPMLTNSRAEFYDRAVRHLLRRDRDLGRFGQLSRYKVDHKEMAVRAIALAAQGDLTPGSDHRVITADEIAAVMTGLRSRFQLGEADLPKMVDEVIERSGLLIRVPGPRETYEFAHLTLQEYLAAVELADTPDRLLALYRENPARWRETVKLWCAGARRDATDVVRQIAAEDRLLALECIAEARSIDAALATGIVNQFADRLGTDVPDKPRVLAALGAVAGNPGPIGEDLFVRLRNQATPSWIREGLPDRPFGQAISSHVDAIAALAESRRRAAIEILSELSGKMPKARAALRSTGELAIPVLARRAANGVVAAVDDLAAIGTPAAAVVIAEQLWGPERISIRAAWHLAALVSVSDVEAELGRFDPEQFRHGHEHWHDWLWAPFVPKAAARSGMAVTMGRVGWLIDQSEEQDVPPDAGSVDPRLALGLGAQPGTFADRSVPEELQHQLRETAGVSDRRRNHYLVASWEADDFFAAAQEGNPDGARRVAEAVLDARVKSWRARRLLGQLPLVMLVGLATRLWSTYPRERKFDVRTQDWLAVTEQPERPTTLLLTRCAVNWFALALVVVLVGLGLIRSTGTLIGWWAGGSPLLAALVVLVAAVAGVAFLIDKYGSSGFDWDVVWVLAVLIGAVMASWVALPTAAGWIGWPAVIGLVGVTVAAVFVVNILTLRRERALRNPYRAILQLDIRALQPGQTVIARKASGTSDLLDG